MINIQSNSIRGETLQNVAGMVVQEIMSDILPMFGPGASDAFITKEGQPYYTRDGMEVMSSLVFDNELANYIHHIFFQAAYHHGKKVGDGSTTVIAVYLQQIHHQRYPGEVETSYRCYHRRAEKAHRPSH